MGIDKSKIKFRYFFVRTQEGLGRITCAIYTENKEDFYIGFSFCSPKDNFNKKLGKIKAIGKLNSLKHRCNFLINPNALEYYNVNSSSIKKLFLELLKDRILQYANDHNIRWMLSNTKSGDILQKFELNE